MVIRGLPISRNLLQAFANRVFCLTTTSASCRARRMSTRCYRRSERALNSVFSVALLMSTAFAYAETETRPCGKSRDAAQTVIGSVEKVRLMDVDIEQRARIDTGAGVGSVNATIVRIVRGDRSNRPDRVVFSLEDGKGSTKKLEREIVDWVRIKNKGARGSTRRPVVTMTICLAGKIVEDRMNLADRQGFIYPILIGRNFLKAGRFLVDSGASYTRSPSCN